MNAYLDKLHMDWNLFSLQLVITFAHFLWQGTLVAIVLAVLLRALARDAAYARYVTSWIAFVLLPFFVVGTFLVVSCAGAPMIADQKRADRVTRFEETMPTSPVSSIPAGPTFPPMEEALANRPDEFAAGQASAASLNHSGTQPRQRLSVLLSMWSPYVSALYAVVTSAMLWRLGRSMQQCNRIKHSVTDLTDQRLLRIVSERARKMGLPRVPAIGFCDQVAVPVVVGMLRPLIVIPPAIHFRLSEAHLLAIIGHELAHIRRYDILFNLVQRIVEALLFFHPATWWISRHVSRERENCCDDLAAATAGRLSYVAALLQMAELCLGNDRPRRAMLATLSADGGRSSNLGARVRRLLGDQPSTHIAVSRSVTGTAVSIALLLIATLVAWGQNQVGDELATVDDPLKKHNVFAPEPTWYIKLAANEGASE
ncbi:MAG: M48 family metalloprotease, partial [Planctomycetales bacterium]|nr:M48 family metalloprotease [Planctomycetales bacterium]